MKVRVFDSVRSASSSSEKLAGLRPPPAVKAKSCASFGRRVLDHDDAARRFGSVKVQVTVSPADRAMFDTGLPSSQVALAWSQPLGTVSDSE